mgnify:FL=1
MVESSGRGMKMYEAQKKYDEKTFERIAFRIGKSSTMSNLIDLASSKNGESVSRYVLTALTRKLTKDGFLPPKEE